jgi:hypothetical protein
LAHRVITTQTSPNVVYVAPHPSAPTQPHDISPRMPRVTGANLARIERHQPTQPSSAAIHQQATRPPPASSSDRPLPPPAADIRTHESRHMLLGSHKHKHPRSDQSRTDQGSSIQARLRLAGRKT